MHIYILIDLISTQYIYHIYSVVIAAKELKLYVPFYYHSGSRPGLVYRPFQCELISRVCLPKPKKNMLSFVQFE